MLPLRPQQRHAIVLHQKFFTDEREIIYQIVNIFGINRFTLIG